MSELEVTPQFQKFVGNKLDDFLENTLKMYLRTKKLLLILKMIQVNLNCLNEVKLL